MTRDSAHSLMNHYFRLVWERAGLKWTSDNDAEVRQLVDDLIDVAKAEAVAEAQAEAESRYGSGDWKNTR